MGDGQARGDDDLVRDEDDHDLLTFSETAIRLRQEIALTEAALREGPAPERRAALNARLSALTDALRRARDDQTVAVSLPWWDWTSSPAHTDGLPAGYLADSGAGDNPLAAGPVTLDDADLAAEGRERQPTHVLQTLPAIFQLGHKNAMSKDALKKNQMPSVG